MVHGQDGRDEEGLIPDLRDYNDRDGGSKAVVEAKSVGGRVSIASCQLHLLHHHLNLAQAGREGGRASIWFLFIRLKDRGMGGRAINTKQDFVVMVLFV